MRDIGNNLIFYQLINYLSEMNFKGTVSMRFHSGVFCELKDDSGNTSLADDLTDFSKCSLKAKGEDLESAGQQDLAYAELQNHIQELNQEFSHIDFQFEAMGSEFTLIEYPDPSMISKAQDWNRVAARNHRMEFILQSSTERQFSNIY